MGGHYSGQKCVISALQSTTFLAPTPPAATELTTINRNLETLTLMTYILPGSTEDLDEDDAPGEAGTGAFSNLLKK